MYVLWQSLATVGSVCIMAITRICCACRALLRRGPEQHVKFLVRIVSCSVPADIWIVVWRSLEHVVRVVSSVALTGTCCDCRK